MSMVEPMHWAKVVHFAAENSADDGWGIECVCGYAPGPFATFDIANEYATKHEQGDDYYHRGHCEYCREFVRLIDTTPGVKSLTDLEDLILAGQALRAAKARRDVAGLVSYVTGR